MDGSASASVPLSRIVEELIAGRRLAAGEAENVGPAEARAVRRRRALWELNPSVHSSVVGTCLTTAELRKTMGRVLERSLPDASDHELHSQAVGLCDKRNDGSKALQKALDRRHRAAVNRFSKLSGEETVLAHWAEALRVGDIPGAYWAVLTHPDVGPGGTRRAFGDVHMLSHLVGAANRADWRPSWSASSVAFMRLWPPGMTRFAG